MNFTLFCSLNDVTARIVNYLCGSVFLGSAGPRRASLPCIFSLMRELL